MITITPLDAWIRRKICSNPALSGESFLADLESYQLSKINKTIEYARQNTGFYRNRLDLVKPLKCLSDITAIPFTESLELNHKPFDFLAVSQHEVARIVTLRTSGSTGSTKRLFFTEADLELTIDFFRYGMSTLVQPGQKVAVLLPGEKPDSVGDLLRKGLLRMNVEVLSYGPVSDPDHAAEIIGSFQADCLVGIPTQVLAIARSRSASKLNCVRNILLSTDYVPRAIAGALSNIWGCRVFNHYGMTEMGLGGGVDCEDLGGYHLREADLYFEIVDRITGDPCPAGTIGEVVFTTLTRQGTPLIRYRTGDVARMLPEPCRCGTVLRRMDWVRGRWNGIVQISPTNSLLLSELDEVLFELPQVLDYRVTTTKREGALQLHLDVYTMEDRHPSTTPIIEQICRIQAIQTGIASGEFLFPTVAFSPEARLITNGTSKRQIAIDNFEG
ncbi:MAG TPA: AMP-binding protein [Syntrophorhabdaceae bacterium]|nr:AMP-binding protein [Syntrophorhabdaceae bacterium]